MKKIKEIIWQTKLKRLRKRLEKQNKAKDGTHDAASGCRHGSVLQEQAKRVTFFN